MPTKENINLQMNKLFNFESRLILIKCKCRK